MAITNHIWDELSDNVLFETDGNGAVVAEYTHEPQPFGEVLSQRRASTDHYFQFDGFHSTRQLTDENGDVSDSYTYSAFGEEVSSSGSTTTPFRYKGAAGYYTEMETGDLYVRARTYQPISGRWLSRDPLGFVDGPSLYRGYFVPGGVDPSGKTIVLYGTAAEILSTVGFFNALCPGGGFYENWIGRLKAKKGFCEGRYVLGVKTCTIPLSIVGPVVTVPRPAFYWIDPKYKSSATPISCKCVCAAINSWARFNVANHKGARSQFRTAHNVSGTGPRSGDINVQGPSNLAVGLDGARVPSPGFIVLAHELCGHGFGHDGKETIVVENEIRGEHGLPLRSDEQETE